MALSRPRVRGRAARLPVPHGAGVFHCDVEALAEPTMPVKETVDTDGHVGRCTGVRVLYAEKAAAGRRGARRQGVPCPDIKFTERGRSGSDLRGWSERWMASRIHVSAGTAQKSRRTSAGCSARSATTNLLPWRPPTFAELVGVLHHNGLRRESIRKTSSRRRGGARLRKGRAGPGWDCRREAAPELAAAEVSPPTQST